MGELMLDGFLVIHWRSWGSMVGLRGDGTGRTPEAARRLSIRVVSTEMTCPASGEDPNEK